MRTSFCPLLAVLIAAAAVGGDVQHADRNGALQFNVHKTARADVACRIHVINSNGIPQSAEGKPFWEDHFVCEGSADVAVAPGRYTWRVERGPEWSDQAGTVEVASGEVVNLDVTLQRHTSLNAEGWYSGDMHVHRAVRDVPLLMRAEDLNFAPVITWWNTPAKNPVAADKTEFRFDKNRIYTTLAGEDERQGGALIYFGLNRPLDLSVRSRDFPSPMHFVAQAKHQNADVWIDIEKPFWWDVPTWLATGKMDSIGIAHNHMHRSGVLDNEAWGKPSKPSNNRGPSTNGLWTQEIYYHVLNCNLRIPPSAGSASGVLPNPVGYNRAYTYLGEKSLSRDAWFAALKAGRCFVTNGPLLRVRANEQLPGTSLKSAGPFDVQLEVKLNSNDPVSKLEVVANGKVVKQIDTPDHHDSDIRVSVQLDEPGWFLVRAIADVDHTFRFASTAPWYVEFDNAERRISRASSQFFLDWVEERIEQVNQTVGDSKEREAVLQWHVQAREFWRDRRDMANSD